MLGIEHSKNKMVGRGVLLDIARFRGVKWMQDGEHLERRARQVRQDRTSKSARAISSSSAPARWSAATGRDWGGYAGGDAPGVKFENCYWCQDKQIAAICTDTWGVEVRPNETGDANQPWHWVVIPAMGLCMGEIFYLKDLAQDCDEDGVYDSSSAARR